MKNLFFAVALVLGGLTAVSAETAGSGGGQLGENIDNCPKGCECISDSSRTKFDRLGVIKTDTETTTPTESESTKTISK